MKKGFTLIELVVVMSIVGVLATIGFTSYVSYSETSRDVSRISNLNDLKKSLELTKSSVGDYPTPDEAFSVYFDGKEIWKQGIVGPKTKKHIKFQSTQLDPKYEDIDYTYTLSSDGDKFEIGTIIENDENLPLGRLFTNTFANSSEIAFTHGNYHAKFFSTKENGITTVFSIPSMTMNSDIDVHLNIDQSTDDFVIQGTQTIPASYSGVTETNNQVTFTPRLLYVGENCGVETDQEIVNFIANLRDSFNSEDFISNENYQSIFEDYITLRNDIRDFDTLKLLGLKINKVLGCNITNFKTVDIFPTQCGYETLDFDLMENGFDIETQSCLFNYHGEGAATVISGEGVGGSEAIIIDPTTFSGVGTFSYRVFSYIPMKFKYDMKTNLEHYSYVNFKVNGNDYLTFNQNTENYNDDFHEVETPLLEPGLYDFEWEVFQRDTYDGEIYLDNFEFICQGGGTSCGRDLGFENGDTAPYNLLDFSGEVNTAWPRVSGSSDTTEGTYAIMSPNETGTANITYTRTFDETTKFNFDIKTDFGTYGQLKFYINGVEYFRLGRYNYRDWGNYNDGYRRFTSPLLEAGQEYIFEWKAYTTRSDKTFLDNIHFTCVGGGVGCGMDMGFEPSDDNSFFNKLTFGGDTAGGGTASDPWILTGTGTSEGMENVATGDYAITNPFISSGNRTMTYSETLDQPAKFHFDVKTDFSNNNPAQFLINGNVYLPIGYQNYKHYPRYDDGYIRYTTPLLPAGDYEFTWYVEKGFNGTERLFLDNFGFTCINGVGEGCLISDLGFEDGNNTMEDLGITFTGSSNTPWSRVTGNWEYVSGSTPISYSQTFNSNTAIKSPAPDYDDNTIMNLETTLFVDSYINFDFMSYIGNGSAVRFYIDGNLEMDLSTYPDVNTWTAVSIPVSAGTHTFSWESKRGYRTFPYLWLDNINFTNQ
ncbi:prepilin-type N-terminal cleavage/methylation domain-containing protein [Candidatus Gracilibacteria bacterium]|nr:prepilin-type N-terminal cleavage/methylation domain-containing protein [Candidatus Gracilibacteria bacterium]